MAFCIYIDKLTDTPQEATFRFYDTGSPNEVGELRLDKLNESISMTIPARDALFARAARKVAVAYKAGPLPESLAWES